MFCREKSSGKSSDTGPNEVTSSTLSQFHPIKNKSMTIYKYSDLPSHNDATPDRFNLYNILQHKIHSVCPQNVQNMCRVSHITISTVLCYTCIIYHHLYHTFFSKLLNNDVDQVKYEIPITDVLRSVL